MTYLISEMDLVISRVSWLQISKDTGRTKGQRDRLE